MTSFEGLPTFEYLSTSVTSNSRDTHLGHDFEHALRTSFDVVPDRCLLSTSVIVFLFDEIFDRFDCRYGLIAPAP